MSVDAARTSACRHIRFKCCYGGEKGLHIDSTHKTRIPSLDGLRALSIALVMTSHSIPGTHSFWFRLIFLHADLGVRVFFVISGFLITSLLLQERSISLRLFYIRRTLRILPAFLLFVGTVAVLNALGVIFVPPGNWVYVLTYTFNYDTHPPWVLGHLWSLSVEEQFYLLWPLAMKFLRPRGWTVVAVVSVFCGSVVRWLGLIDPAMHYAFPFVCGPIALGCLLALHAARIRRFVVGLSGWLFVLAVPLIAWLDAVDATLATNLLVTLCVARVVFLPVGWLNALPLVWLGRISYPLYLFQQLFLDSMGTAPISVLFPFNIAAALAAALFCYYVVEARFVGLRSRFRGAGQKPGEKITEHLPGKDGAIAGDE